MPVNYVSDSNGDTIAVQIPIEEWKRIKNKYPDVDDGDGVTPDWQRQLVTDRLQTISNNPDRLKPITELYQELDKDE